MESSIGNNLLASIVPAQIYIALQHYSLLYSIAGAPTWYMVYNSAYIYLGLIPAFIGITLIFNSRIKKISTLLYIAILILIIYAVFAGNTLLFYIAQTKFYGYLTIL